SSTCGPRSLSGRFFGDGLLEVVQRLAQSGGQINLRLPSQQLPRLGDVGAALLRIVGWKGFVANLALLSRGLQNRLGAFRDGELVRIANVDRQMFVRFRKTHEAVDFVAHVTEASSL